MNTFRVHIHGPARTGFETYDVVGTRSENNGAESGCGSLEGDNSGVTNFFN